MITPEGEGRLEAGTIYSIGHFSFGDESQVATAEAAVSDAAHSLTIPSGNFATCFRGAAFAP